MKKPIVNVNDIIKITSSDISFNDIFLITKIQDNDVYIKSSLYSHILIIDGDKVSNSAITSLDIISGIGAQGYADYNKLNLNETVTIEFNNSTDGLTGKIISINDDVITIEPAILRDNILQSNDNIIIDFSYKGLPDNIKSINIVENNDIERGLNPINVTKINEPESEYNDEYDEYDDNDDITSDKLHEILDSANIIFGDLISKDETSTEEVSDDNRRYDIDKQLTDMLDGMFANTSSDERGSKTILEINKTILRFKQLRDTFSEFDNDGIIISATKHGIGYKPSVDVIKNLDKRLYWLLPNVTNTKRVYPDNFSEDDAVMMKVSDITESVIETDVKQFNGIFDRFKTSAIDLKELLNGINDFTRPFTEPHSNKNVISHNMVKSDLLCIVDNIPGMMESSVYARNTTKGGKNERVVSKKMALQTYNTGITQPRVNKIGGNITVSIEPVTESEFASITSITMLPLTEGILNFSRINLTSLNILDRANINKHFINMWKVLDTYIETDVDNQTNISYDNVCVFKIPKNSDIYSNTPRGYELFLNRVIPSTEDMIENIKPNLSRALTLNSYIDALEPLMIYNKDINHGQYNEIQKLLQYKIDNYKLQFTSRNVNAKYIQPTYKVSPILLQILSEMEKTLINSAYDLPPGISDMMVWNKVLALDGGIIYNYVIMLRNMHLNRVSDSTENKSMETKPSSSTVTPTSPQYYPFTPTELVPTIENKEILEDSRNIENLDNPVLTQTIINARLNKHVKLSARLKYIKNSIDHKYEYQKFSLAKLSHDDPSVKSPFNKLLNDILTNNDIYTSSTDLLRFVDLYTRAADLKKGENNYWLYCNVSGATLIPTFKVKLASSVLSNTYIDVLAQICSSQGKSDNGLIVDEFTGWTIRHMDEGNDDKYNADGFLLKTGEVLESDEKPIIPIEEQSPVSIYNLKIKTVITTMSNKLSINISESEVKYIVDGVDDVIGTFMMTQEQWDYQSKNSSKAILPLNDYVNQIIIWITLSFFIISIQTTIPAIISNVSISNCSNSFEGYPVFSSDNKNNPGITFLACVANSIGVDSKHSLWKSMSSIKNTKSIKQITEYLNTITETLSFKNKIEEFNKNKGVKIQTETHMIGWTNFMPPLTSFKPTQSNTINDNWEKDLFTSSDDLRKYSVTLSAIYSKMIEFGLNMVGIINETVDKGRIVSTVTNKVETTCCIDTTSNTLNYFTKTDNRIKIINDNASRLGDLLKKNRNMEKSYILCITPTLPSITTHINERIIRPFSTETIYAMYNKQCNLDNDMVIPIKLRGICHSKPIIDYNETPSDIIMKLQTSGFKFNSESMNKLLNIISVVRETKKEPLLTQTDKLRKILTENSGIDILHIDFIEKFMGFINAETSDMIEVHKNKLLNFILINISSKWKKITNVFKENPSSMTQKERTSLFEFMDATFINPKIQNNDDYGFKYIAYLKKCIRNVTTIFPNMLLSVKKNRVEPIIPKHWKITSGAHERDLKSIFDARFKMMKDIEEPINDMIRIYIKEMSVLNKLIETTFAKTSFGMSSGGGGGDTRFDLLFTKKIMMYYLCIAVDSFINNSRRFDAPTQAKVCKIMVSFIKLMSEDKLILDYELSNVMKMVRESSNKEKTLMTTKLGEMSHDERQVDNELKKNKQEGWETGAHNQRYTKYNADVADKEYKIRGVYRPINDIDVRDDGDVGDVGDIIDVGEDDDRDIDDDNAETDDEEYGHVDSDND